MALCGLVFVLMCGSETLRAIGYASGRVKWDSFDPEHECGTQDDQYLGELAMCCAVLWIAEQLRIADSMRMEIRYDSKDAAAAAQGTQRCSSNTR